MRSRPAPARAHLPGAQPELFDRARSGTIYESVTGDPPTTIERGSRAEQRAVELLVRKGYQIVERNFRTKLGELDIIARLGPTLVFVEVRSRHTSNYGSALDAVGWRKQRKVSRVASQYLAQRRPRFISARFDVVGITGDEIVHIEDAWRLSNG